MAQKSANFFWEKNYENLMKALTVLNHTPNKNFLARIVPEFDVSSTIAYVPIGHHLVPRPKKRMVPMGKVPCTSTGRFISYLWCRWETN